LFHGHAAERDAVIEGAAVADLRGLADHHTHAVVDEDAPADGAPGWISIPVRKRVECEASRASQRRPIRHIAVRDAMQLQRVEARIAGDHLPDRARGGIAVENAVDVFADAAEHETQSRIPE
jgi:hypothetical protein